MIVCICHRVSDRDIARAVQGGCRSFDQLQDTLRVASACGACRECAQEVLSRQKRAADERPLRRAPALAAAC
jgi:bacterioferritin-associated ferredoxin